ncbi:TetR/AcrR family transcriptional regulator [Aciduricibacillus chroicocephali]|uniref:TetR/AcrR family transcriptional regulator n=1 Tax=Aciduricibacillus chroicocephali TaxID=3054939 RepID=A0ABY9KUJ8_9BACI|nr:TetR/AcrR family transcriptional regulator [Bacillaceae bacterium 44XB]
MDTKALLIEEAKNLFQQKGYKGVGLNEILKECEITKGALYHHFPNGKEELLISCLQSMQEEITTDIDMIFQQHSSTLTATKTLVDKLTAELDSGNKIAGYTFSSIVSEISSLSEPVRNACTALYEEIQKIYFKKLLNDGYPEEEAASLSLFMTVSIEGAMTLCLAKDSTLPLSNINAILPRLLKD